MIPSPFHGIFSSAFTASHGGGTAKQAKKTADGIAPEEGDTTQDIGSVTAPKKASAHQAPAAKPPQRAAGQARSGTVGQVALDIFEYDSYYILKAPIAGVKLQDIDIEVNDSVVTIRGTRRQADQIPQDQYYLQECFWGDFERSVTLPCSIDARKVKATLNKECVLKILVPKEEKIRIIRINE